MKIFLSHATQDKSFVSRLNESLTKHGLETWLDEKDVPFGGSIAGEIEKGLRDSSVLLAVLSQNSIASKWVSTEWQAKLFRHMKEERVSVIPLVLDDCEVPPLLAGLRFLDFRDPTKYEAKLSLLVETLRDGEGLQNEDVTAGGTTSVFAYTTELLNELEDEFIALPFKAKLPIVEQLRRIPRSGKQVRLKRLNLKQKPRPRSVYDHLLSMAHVADCLLPEINHGLPDHDLSELARCIAFHELNEVVLGDIPSYTTLTKKSRQSTKNYAEVRLSTVPVAERERIANQFIWLFLGEKQRQSMQAVISTLENEKSKLYITFKMLDQIDPIIAVWRYLYHYKDSLGPDPRRFITEMKDFFENPAVRAFLRDNKVDQKVIDLASKLQNREFAWTYYANGDKLLKQRPFALRTKLVLRMIEGVPLYSQPPPSRRRRRG